MLRYEPEEAPAGHTLGLIGKGITFDSGGLSLKPADSMERMKDDMAGAATVVAAIRAIALERLPIRVMAIVASTENMPGGRALKPGDVITGAAGLTVEVNNTDAEGRLILGDALWYARQLGATHLIDVATLTGSVVVALGKITTGLYGTPQSWVSHIRDAAARAGEKIWQLPLFDEYREQLDSDIADLLNSPGRPAGSITAALFLKEFAGNGAVGAPGHRRHGVGRREETVAAKGRHRRDDSHARGSRARRAARSSGCLRSELCRIRKRITPTIIQVVKDPPAQQISMIDVAVGAFGLDRRDHGRGARRRAARRRADRLVSHAPPDHAHRSARRPAQSLPNVT